MRKKTVLWSEIAGFILWIGFIGSNPLLLAEEALVPDSGAKPSSFANQAPPLLTEAREWADAGEFLKARESYRSFLEGESADAELRSIAQAELGTVSMKILFSPTETPESFTYTIVKGDNLHDIAKKNKTTVDLLKKSNQLTSGKIFPGMKLKIIKGKFHVRVDKSDNLLELYLDDALLRTYRVATGADNSTPTGTFTIKTKLENPTWYNAGAVVAPDSPDNILGTRWMGFSLKGYGIHGTTEPETIGQQVSAGCIRMLNEDVEELYSILPYGTSAVVED